MLILALNLMAMKMSSFNPLAWLLVMLAFTGCSERSAHDICEHLIQPLLHDPESMKVLESQTTESSLARKTEYTTFLRYTASNLLGARTQNRDRCVFSIKTTGSTAQFSDIVFTEFRVGDEIVSKDDFVILSIKAAKFLNGE